MTDKLKGFLQSGLLFIGDPAYMSGDTRPEVRLPEEELNPFINWDNFTNSIGGEDANLAFPGALNEQSTGRGCVVQTGRLSGRYELIKEFCPSTGKLLELRIKFHD